MPKGQRGNKEAKKPKQVRVPDAPGLPTTPAPSVSQPQPKKR